MQLCGRGIAVVLLFLAFPVDAQLTPQRDLSGNWIGSANLTSAWRDQRCHYRGSLNSVQLWLQQSGDLASGGGKISIPLADGSPDCKPLFKMYTISGVVSGTRFNFSDPAGNTWRLNFTSTLLGGRVGFTGDAPNPNEALVIGASRPNGDTSLTRLSGTVTLRRQSPMDLDRINTMRMPASQELRMAFREPRRSRNEALITPPSFYVSLTRSALSY